MRRATSSPRAPASTFTSAWPPDRPASPTPPWVSSPSTCEAMMSIALRRCRMFSPRAPHPAEAERVQMRSSTSATRRRARPRRRRCIAAVLGTRGPRSTSRAPQQAPQQGRSAAWRARRRQTKTMPRPGAIRSGLTPKRRPTRVRRRWRRRLTRQAARPLPPRAETQAPAPRRRQWTMPCAALRGRAGGRRRPHTSVTIC